MRQFWDRAAEDDAFYFVDNRLDYRRPDLDRFWAEGERDLEVLLDVVDAPALRAGDEVVEIGCGVGRLTRALASRVRSVRALDISERMLALAREHNAALANVEWVHGDGASLTGIGDANADVCLSHVVFQHIPDPTVTLGYVREIGRVLRPGGWAAFQLSNDPAVHRRRGGLRAWARGQRNPAWLGSAVELEDLRATCADAGLAIERTYGEGTQYCVALARREPARAPQATG